MSDFDTGQQVAELLASVWELHRSPAFFRHFELVYGVRVPDCRPSAGWCWSR